MAAVAPAAWKEKTADIRLSQGFALIAGICQATGSVIGMDPPRLSVEIDTITRAIQKSLGLLRG